ncbi:MAG: enoyl-CoA hydratase-related protein [Bacteroidetes bacterium]|nr:enoyl-CoA hydratase-related protein [Bacteroidota bacterium]
MKKLMRKSTLEALDLGTVADIFNTGKLPVSLEEIVDKVFGDKHNRGAMVISGAGGIVGAGKVMQFASRLMEMNVPIIALDLPGAPDGIARQYKGLQASFGTEGANQIMKNIVKLNYDGNTLPESLKQYNPKFLLEAIPEKLELKKAHYDLFKNEYPNIHIWSVTSGFPSKELGVGIAHPAFPHEINKVFEIVESKPSAHTHLLWAMGLIPMQVSDDWSFVLDVFFCGLLQASIQFCNRTNTPYWKTDKYIRQIMGPNPFRAHDVIGAKGSNFLTWSCLYHLGKEYGALFEPTAELTERKESGLNWYPANHFRPLVGWQMDEEQSEELKSIVYGALIQMTTIMLHEKRADLATMNAIGELCAQFTNGLPAFIRRIGTEKALEYVKKYHALEPNAAKTKWYPETLQNLNSPEWQQLYVNAEHDGTNGYICISRESYNYDVNAELNRAIDWLHKEGIHKVVLTSDFHFSTQMVGADTTEFFPAVTDSNIGEKISADWSKTARRLYHEFEISIGFVNGKRCMGGMLELMMHCQYLIAPTQVKFAMPEVTLPVIPGMEGCHWVFRKTSKDEHSVMLDMLMHGKQVNAQQAQGFLVDYTGSLQECLVMTKNILAKGDAALTKRSVVKEAMPHIASEIEKVNWSDNPLIQSAQKEIADCIIAACSANMEDALQVQAKVSAKFMSGQLFRKGKIGLEYDKMINN